MTASDLAGGAEILGRLAASLDKPGSDGRVRVPFQKKFFGALQQLLKGTEWDGRFCWDFARAFNQMGWHATDGSFQCGDTILCVDVRPLPRYCKCATCGGEGRVEVTP